MEIESTTLDIKDIRATLSDVKIIELPKIEDPRGNLSFIEENKHTPFKIERTYWIYDVPGGQLRGGHAFKKQKELIVALSGSFDVIVDDGKRQKTYSLNRSYYGLYLPAGLWRYMDNFSTNSLAIVMSSTLFSEEDYIRDYKDYLQIK
jgi:dTDP-4-dehydrorhamnose 3,5-epimerase-like enzyme